MKNYEKILEKTKQFFSTYILWSVLMSIATANDTVLI